jgi:hypothetical protein
VFAEFAINVPQDYLQALYTLCHCQFQNFNHRKQSTDSADAERALHGIVTCLLYVMFFMLLTEVHEVRVDILCFVRTELCRSSCTLFSSSSGLETLGDEPLSNRLRKMSVTRRTRVCRYGNQCVYSASIAKTRKRSPHQHVRQL